MLSHASSLSGNGAGFLKPHTVILLHCNFPALSNALCTFLTSGDALKHRFFTFAVPLYREASLCLPRPRPVLADVPYFGTQVCHESLLYYSLGNTGANGNKSVIVQLVLIIRLRYTYVLVILGRTNQALHTQLRPRQESRSSKSTQTDISTPKNS